MKARNVKQNGTQYVLIHHIQKMLKPIQEKHSYSYCQKTSLNTIQLITFSIKTLKITDSCMNNINSILSTHNKNFLNPKQTSFG